MTCLLINTSSEFFSSTSVVSVAVMCFIILGWLFCWPAAFQISRKIACIERKLRAAKMADIFGAQRQGRVLILHANESLRKIAGFTLVAPLAALIGALSEIMSRWNDYDASTPLRLGIARAFIPVLMSLAAAVQISHSSNRILSSLSRLSQKVSNF